MHRPFPTTAGNDRTAPARRGRLARFLPTLLLALAVVLPCLGATRFFWHPEIAPSGPVVVVVSLDEQSIYVYRNGVAIAAGPISSGKPGYETPPGVYTILQKSREHHSNLYDDAPMPYMQRLTWDGIALHGGTLPGHPASHGCVRLPQNFAEKLFGITRRGGVVVVADGKVSPAPIAHPAAVAPIDLHGAPMATAASDADATLAAPVGASSLVVSTYDRRVYLLQDGRLTGSAPLALDDDVPTGTLLYVMTAGPAAPTEQAVGTSLPRWSAYRILGQGPVPDPARMAAMMHVPEDFGRRLQEVLLPGSTVLVTDLPGYGNAHDVPYAKLLESDAVPAASAKPLTPNESR
jgi:hypothetical protein